uniref:Reverse transcriptase domain-containing protein n=1 Tax=Tanacetum cinerariifolium TaxID=118510 RepID=A0A699GQC4_TANCI|nr:hypothetical protein [Tanacetum cinerariifolium]
MSTISNTSQISLVIAITPDLPTKELEYSLSMGDEHLSTISKTELDDVIKSSVKTLFQSQVSMRLLLIKKNPLVDDEESISPKIDPHYLNAEFDLIESLLNRDTLIDSSPKFDYLLEEIKEDDFDLEEEIRLVENLLYDNSSPRPPKELNAEIDDTIVESLSPSPNPLRWITLDLKASHARCFVIDPLELPSLAYGNPISEILLI